MVEKTRPDESIIEGFLKICGQAYEKVDAGLWDVIFEGPTETLDLVIELGEEYLVMAVPVTKDVKAECLANVSYHLARLNNNVDMARFSLNKRHEIMLALEMPVSLLQFADFQKALLLIMSTLGRTYQEIRMLSQDPEKVSSFYPQE
jgi:hypothetical protein